MELEEFLLQTRSEVQAEIDDRLGASGEQYPYPESVFAEIVMKHMADIGMTFEPEVCHYSAKVGGANLRLSGYAFSEDADQVDLFVSLYEGSGDLSAIPDAETKTAAEQCIRFLAKSAEGKLSRPAIDESDDAYALAVILQECYVKLDQIRIYVLTDRRAKAKNFRSREVSGKTVKLEVMDIERLHRHWSEGKPRDELVVNFEEVSGSALPCVYIPGQMGGYDYALTVFPAEALRFIYEKYGARLLEANVRSFLSVTGKVNKGIRETLKSDPGKFMAYNNGIVVVADELRIGRASDGSPGILWLKGMQIVNGGQTTASIYFTKKKNPEIDLGHVRVPAKVIILRSEDEASEEALISDISRFANTQNQVKQSDLSANKPFHTEIEKLSLATICPDGLGKWFYERAAGSYNTMLAREGTTPAKLKNLKQVVFPPARRITKTDLAKFLNTWDQKPELVSRGLQKNFERFMQDLTEEEGSVSPALPDVAKFKDMIAKAIIFKATTKLARLKLRAFQGNVAVFVVSLLANRLGSKLRLEKVWAEQGVSLPLKELLEAWILEVNEVLHRSSQGRMISEWAKKPESWDAVRTATYSDPKPNIPELR